MRIPKRIVACVDGTWYNVDWQEGKSQGNNSNVFRIFSSIKQGVLKQEGKKIEQVAKYFSGIGIDKKPLDKFNDKISGVGCKELIKEVYQFICKEVQTPKDEIWLYGFSRGAYVARVVAGLLHHVSTLSNTHEAETSNGYRQALEFMTTKHQNEIRTQEGLYGFLSNKTRQLPVIQFLGVFDTIKKANNSVRYDISFNNSTKYARHAIALNEHRREFSPELFDPDSTNVTVERSLIQAWFVGAHADLGGGACDDGLALYPLQWMFLESRACGLVLEHSCAKRFFRSPIENPLMLTFSDESAGAKSSEKLVWTFRYNNGIEINMYDLRASHNHGNLQKWPSRKLEKRTAVKTSSHMVRINQGMKAGLVLGGVRCPFADGELKGYRHQDPNGTIIHPSVYFVMETFPRLGIKKALKDMQEDLEMFRASYMESIGPDPWVRTREFTIEMRSYRILICGNTGVGKSTLLNRVFGKPMSQENEGTRGKHDINDGFENDQHPGIIIHDSEGFQSGDKKEVAAFESFIKNRSSNADPDERLHAVWICVETDTTRPIQTAMENIISIISIYAPTIPVFIVGTKKDRFLTMQDGLASEDIRAIESFQNVDPSIATKMATILRDRQMFFQNAFRNDCRGFSEKRMQFSFVSKNDQQSIQALMQSTIEEIPDDEACISLVAAQVCDVRPKIDIAINETLRLLGHAVRTIYTACLLPLSFGVTAPTVSRILCDKIIRCFGFPKISTEYMDDMMNKVFWSNLEKFMKHSIPQNVAIPGGTTGLALSTIFGRIAFAPALPLFDIPPAARLIIKCSCDLILILQCAFRSGDKFITRRDIHDASIEYKAKGRSRTGRVDESIRDVVHEEINKLIPLLPSKQTAFMLSKSNKSRIHAAMTAIIRDNVFKKEDSTRSPQRSYSGSSSLSLSRTSTDPEEIRALFPNEQEGGPEEAG